jgi:Cytochrome c oxidase subunit IV
MTFLQRLGLVLFVLFAADAIVYWSLQKPEYIGTTMIAMTGVGFGFIGLYAFIAVRKARRQEHVPLAGEAHVRGTIWPAVFALSAVGFTLGILVTPWLLVVGGALFVVAAAGWTAETRRQWKGEHAVAGEHPHQSA